MARVKTSVYSGGAIMYFGMGGGVHLRPRRFHMRKRCGAPAGVRGGVCNSRPDRLQVRSEDRQDDWDFVRPGRHVAMRFEVWMDSRVAYTMIHGYLPTPVPVIT
ncbi:hypothetical protein DM02DRAFT_727540 [Periconia macrospinosa]|uniref:Uncharacterized protein n=1 Tax=Periconia macrospinosa TaxID=97972 RepID=A0A2V1DYP4_9PLEO|nr:hypothetical protein DM02DRAFT_727540 [Periconia macrospinosa]